VTLETALSLLALPREVGMHPESGQPITAAIGRFGPYLKHGTIFKSLGKDDDVLTIGLNRAVVLIAEAKAKAAPLRIVGKHPTDQAEIPILRGRFGPYLEHNGVRATLPRGVEPEAISLEQAVEILATRAASGGGANAKRGGKAKAKRANGAAPANPKAKPKAPSKPTATPRAAAAKKPAAKKAAAKKASPAAKSAAKPKSKRSSDKTADGG
jgi:DNA topoisomerase-1